MKKHWKIRGVAIFQSSFQAFRDYRLWSSKKPKIICGCRHCFFLLFYFFAGMQGFRTIWGTHSNERKNGGKLKKFDKVKLSVSALLASVCLLLLFNIYFFGERNFFREGFGVGKCELKLKRNLTEKLKNGTQKFINENQKWFFFSKIPPFWCNFDF